ncbi:MAG: cupin domain-containing protein [Phycisphaerales bacterium]|nr:cupin domain-containing protein [Phycisphaerales bacterium]
MIKRTIQTTTGKKIEGDGIEGVTMKLLVGKEDGAPTFAMRHFSVTSGGCTPRHQHNWEHEVLVLSGTGEIECNGVTTPISGGDSLFVPPSDLHQFRNIGTEELEFICIVPVASACGEPVPGS